MSSNRKILMAAAGNTKLGWELNKAVLPNFLNVANQSSNTYGMFFSPDGLNLYITSDFVVYQYVLSTAWLVSTATYTRSLTSGITSTPLGIHFDTSGTRLFTIDGTGVINRFTLSTPWNISTASYDQGANTTTDTRDIFFSSDGTKLYLVFAASINEYALGSAWNIASITYTATFSTSAQETNAQAMYFKPDGTKMYVMGQAGDDINEYDLSTAWSISTASFVRVSGTVPETNATSLFFKPDGSVVYFVGTSLDMVYTYIATTPWNVSTLKTDRFFRVANQETSPQAIFFKPDGTKMYVMGATGDDVNEYSLSTAWDITSASYVRIFVVSTQETTPNGLFFDANGTRMYVVGSTGDDINQYSLSTAWDLSTASYVRVSLALTETNPQALFFKPDGTKMYVIGLIQDSVYEYDLLTAWNVSTLSYVRVFSPGFDSTPTGIFFKPDGSRMFLYGYTNDRIYSYNLSTPWNISTASFYQQLSLKNLDEIITDIYIRPDGKKLYAIGSAIDAVFEINL
jgi:hypothetical protein